MSPATYFNKTCDSLRDEFYNSFWISSAIHFEQDMILLQQEGFPSTIVSSAIHLNKTCDSSIIHWTRCDSQQGEFLHQVSQFLQLSILNKISFLSNKGFFFLLHFLNFFTCPLNKEMNEYSGMFEWIQFYERSYETWKGWKCNKVSWTQIATLPT